MILNKPLGDASKYAINILDFITPHKLPFNPYVPLLYIQDIKITPEIYPDRPPDRSQLYRHLNPPEENPWLGGVPIGKIISQREDELHKLVVKKFKHKLSSEIYNPPLHLTFKWKDYGGEAQALEKTLEEQKNFNDKYNTWRNKYRIRYCELTDMFFLQVRVNHMFPYAVFECDIQDSQLIFSNYWYLYYADFIDEFEETLIRYHIVQKSFGNKVTKGLSITKLLFPKGRRVHEDNNVFNCRRYNLVPPKKLRY
jgi:hypothetical protein